MRVGDKVSGKEAATKVAREGIHANLVREHWTGPCQITAIKNSGPSYQATLRGGQLREKVLIVLVANVKIFHERLEHLGYDIEENFAHLNWGADLGLVGPSTVAVPLYPLTDRKAVGDPKAMWKWH